MRFERDDTGDHGAGEGLDRGQYCKLARARPVDHAQTHRKTDFQENDPAKKATMRRPAAIPDDEPPTACLPNLAESVDLAKQGKGPATLDEPGETEGDDGVMTSGIRYPRVDAIHPENVTQY